MHNTIRFIGAGAIGTALGNILAIKDELDVCLVTIEEDVAYSITNEHINQKHFPNIPLHHKLKASVQETELEQAGIIFLAIPSSATLSYLQKISDHIPDDAVLVNLAKGFGNENQTIIESLREHFKNPVITLKGPSFAREIINRMPTGFTVGAEDDKFFKLFGQIFDKTEVHLDYSTDIKGVEILSILKNIYAIVMGIVDAHFNSPNLRFMMLTKAFNEMKKILIRFGGKEETLFHYCGVGDFTLTSLNDLSRNRTLGLLIGKGFFSRNISDKIVLEGKIATEVFCHEIDKINSTRDDFPIIHELYKIFQADEYDIRTFVNKVLEA
ncbi:MAG: hypothetical protein K9I94_03835 [Bacteroidales bacterium]|nr:hypothetical protein [Bacteroidales bacterium]